MPTSRMAGQIGRVVGGRYRLVAPIGIGASADVFLADDVSLRRRVAVKVLHAALAHDETFLKRFRAEARTIAALRHPNILAVFDWGEEDDGPYLVLEYLGGGSLRDMLDQGHRLSASQALLVGLEAARALDYAHRRGLVHRDVKPANLLFDDEGRVCIADFGIARALAEATWTEPAGAVVGTARYASPEQARGASVDGRADVYSLALVLVEAVTGQVPFAADTTIATLMARLDGPIPLPPSLGALGQALTPAGAVDPADRIDAAQLVAALDHAARELPAPAPLPLVPVEVLGEPSRPNDPTLLGTKASAANGAAFGAGDAGGGAGGGAAGIVASDAAGSASADGESAAAESAGARRPRRRVWRVLLGAFIAAAVAIAAVVGVSTLRPAYAVPKIVDPAAAAHSALLRHFKVVVRHIRRDGTNPGDLVGQQPAPGRKVHDGATITVFVSDGPTLVTLPALTGLDESSVRSKLADLGLIVGAVDRPYDDHTPKGTVLATNPAFGAALPKGSAVGLTIANGPHPVALPNLRGDTLDQAKATLAQLGLPFTELTQNDQTVPAGSVISTTPGAGDVEPGTTITVVVSLGPVIVSVPDVTGESVAQAQQDLANVGLKVGNIYGPHDGRSVFSTSPSAGARVPQGTAVDLYVKHG